MPLSPIIEKITGWVSCWELEGTWIWHVCFGVFGEFWNSEKVNFDFYVCLVVKVYVLGEKENYERMSESVVIIG